MRFFFRTWRDIRIVIANLSAMNCPKCGMAGTLILHGFLRGFLSPKRRGIRGRRVRCKKSKRRKGCGVTFSLKLAATLPRRCFRARGLWAFIQRLRDGMSVKAAWEQCGIRLSLDTGYALYKRLQLCQPVLRTQLCSRSPPPKEGSGAASPLLKVFDHLQVVFGDESTVTAFQEALQRDFLATS